MKQPNLVLVFILSFATAIAAVYLINPPHRGENGQSSASVTEAETSFERVIRTGTIRCGYEFTDGAVMKDEATGQIKGPWVDIMNAMGAALTLKIEWVSQVDEADVDTELKSGKIDAMCAAMRANAADTKEITFSTPLAYQALEAFVRNDDHRFDDNLSLLDDPGVKLSVIENGDSDAIAQQDFSKAQKDQLSATTGTGSALLTEVMTGKADAAFVTPAVWHAFDKANPGKLRPASDKKLRVYGLVLATDNDDLRLPEMINAGVGEIQNSGALDKILDQANQQWPDMYIKPLKPYP